MIEIPGILDNGASRRRFLRLGAYGALASALNQSRLVASETTPKKTIRSCIMLMLYGGPSHLDTWDMKPNAPSDIRGEYRPIRTNIPGRMVCEHLPGCARIMDKMAVIRSMHHGLINHNSAVYQAMVGRPPELDDAVLGVDRARDFPNFGAAISYAASTGALPQSNNPLTTVALPHVMHNVVDLPGQNAGFLGGKHDPLQISSDPNQANFVVRNLSLPKEIGDNRMRSRQNLLRLLDGGIGAGPEVADLGEYQRRAFDLLRNDSVQSAFRIDRESKQTRDRYGRHKLGQSLLLARRLVESGVRFINVHDGVNNGQDANWDSHKKIFPRHRELLPPFDQGFSALIDDLDDRGLLESTLVIVMGEFGRSPKINKDGGRDHWPSCYSMALAGGGVEGGALYGASDRIGAVPESDPVTPGDLAATVFWRFGVDHKHEINDPLDRPFPLATGKPIHALFPGAS